MYFCIGCMTYFDVRGQAAEEFPDEMHLGAAAVRAVEYVAQGTEKKIEKAWERARAELLCEDVRKRCLRIARETLLCLCREGKISGVRRIKHEVTKKYQDDAIRLLRLLEKNPGIADTPEGFNSIFQSGQADKTQLQVVLALWNKGLIRP